MLCWSTEWSAHPWSAPPSSVVKLNADASLVDEGLVGLGIAVRNHKGKIIFVATRRTRAFWPLEVDEAKALFHALRLGKKYHLQHIILESDCKVVIDCLSKGATFAADIGTVLCNILSLCTNFNSVIWSHVTCDGNCVANSLAKLVPFRVEQIW
ncbi:uncharacterized protein LOC110719936 [Chenopodium quinoa]|uniref:uncharacterized protein LOC110719936 n=1 Tax=Chenopodium quinoa TaxID=63459 RepID=UPI000B787070|nr:uncharacterized protein LOC110719936 [Chenopodium quinoa]